MRINLHQLEIFYYVARHGGPTIAAQKMPYGIDPSTIRRQLRELERDTGLTLYARRTFTLTPAGENLFEALIPVFEKLPGAIEAWRSGLPDSVRLGAPAVVLREYLPPILATLQKKFPGMRMTCSEASQPQLETLLKQRIIDVAVMILGAELPGDYVTEPLARLPLVLLVPRKSKLRSATELWRQKEIVDTLICLPPDNPITQQFVAGLHRRHIEWPSVMEVNSLELVEAYSSKGLGLGVSLQLPTRKLAAAGVRALPLNDFPQVPVGLVWRRKANPTLEALITQLRHTAKQLMKR